MGNTILKNVSPVARKQHRCCLCDNMIAKGEKHRHWSGIYDGDFYSTRTHTRCIETHLQFEDSFDDTLMDVSAFRDVTIDAGLAEYYLDENNERQWRWKDGE